MIVLNPHLLDLKIFESKSISIENLNTEQTYIDVEIKYYNNDNNRYALIIAYIARQYIVKCYIKLTKDQTDVVVYCNYHNGSDFLIIRDEYTMDVIFIDLDKEKEIVPKLYTGPADSVNSSYIRYTMYYYSLWNDIYIINENLLGIDVENSNNNQMFFIRFNLATSSPYFLVQSCNNIDVFGEYSIYYDDNIISITDYPSSEIKKRTREYLCLKDTIVSIVNRSSIDKKRLKPLLNSIDYSLTYHSPEKKKYKIQIYNKDNIVLKISSVIDNEPICFIVYDDTGDCETMKNIINFSTPDTDSSNQDSRFMVTKKDVDKFPIVIDLEDRIVSEIDIIDEVFIKNTTHKDISISNNGKYMFMIGNVMHRIPYFNVYKLNFIRGTSKRVKNKYATEYRVDVDGYWENNELILAIEDADEYPRFKINKSNELIFV